VFRCAIETTAYCRRHRVVHEREWFVFVPSCFLLQYCPGSYDMSRPSDTDPSKLESLFAAVAELVREETPASESSSNEQQLRTSSSNDEKLQLYGLYKHVMEGSCPGDQPPSLLQVVARSKYQAWDTRRSYTREQAMKEYVERIAARDDGLGRQCQQLLEEFTRKSESSRENAQDGEIAASEEQQHEHDNDTTNNNNEPTIIANRISSLPETGELETSANSEIPLIEHQTYWELQNLVLLLSSWTTYLCQSAGIRPLIPRGRLDLSFLDLLFALVQCLLSWRSNTTHACQQLTQQIGDLCTCRRNSTLPIRKSLCSLRLTCRV
jgi:diazepam-binding inhibitor (GABA receptor modulating acyl-CoA-binding protein)